MIVARFPMSFDRGVERNAAEDVGLPVDPVLTPTGGEIRGLGTHYISEEAKQIATRCSVEEGRVNRAISRTFVRSPIPGLYIIPDRGAGERFLREINPTAEVNARCVVYDLTPGERLPETELTEWTDKIRAQLTMAPGLGKSKKNPSAGEQGLAIIEQLAKCPVLSETTRFTILGLVGEARLGSVNRYEFKRRIAECKLEIDTSIAGGVPGRTIDESRAEQQAANETPEKLVSVSPRRAPVMST